MKNSDLGTESIGKLLIRLSVPAIAAQFVNALYNIVDRMYIGNIAGTGKDALTGLGITFPIIMIISAFAAMIGMGGAPRAAIRMGANDQKGANKVLNNCFVMLLGLSVVLTGVFLLFKEPLLYAFGGSAATVPYADQYLTIYLVGTIFVQMSLGLNPFITAQGLSMLGMLTVVIGAIANIILDPIFIFGFGMGVQGAALATIISQATSAVFVVLVLMKNKHSQLKIQPKLFKLDKTIVKSVLILGLSPFIMQSTESLVNIVLNSSLQRYGGDDYVAAMTIIGSVMQLVMMPMMGLSQGAQPIISFNYGAQKYDRVRKAYKSLIVIDSIFAVGLCALVMLIPQVLIGIFNQDPRLMEVGVPALRIFMAGMWAFGIQSGCQQSLVSLGQAKISIFLALLRKIILLIPLALLLPTFGLGTTGVFLAEPIADIGAATTTGLVFLFQIKKILAKKPPIEEVHEVA